MTQSPKKQIATLAKELGILRASDLASKGIARTYLTQLVDEGLLVKDSRGLYHHADHPTSTNIGLALVAKKYPNSIICLLSALRYHEIGTQNPWEVWISIDRKARKPKMDYPPIRIFRHSKENLQSGFEIHTIDGVPVKITTPERTVAECFKYRNKVGIDVCIEALREAWRSKQIDMNKLTHEAKACRIYNVLRPYAEAIV
jgi:predicted transcriptional regulator of viral defense system